MAAAEYFMSHYAAQEDEIYRTYTALPETLPQRVKDFAQENFADGSDYTKAKNIEFYLSESFPYVTDMPKTPPGADFVDYFLFVQKQGYCVYYASAMTVLCRSLGIPARYVEGFAPSKQLKGTDYQYTDKEAHAWTDIDGVGWLRFEPTSGYGGFNQPPDEPSAAPNPSIAPETVTPAPKKEPAFVSPSPAADPSAADSSLNWEAPSPLGVPNKSSRGWIFWLLGLGSATVIAICWVMVHQRRTRFVTAMGRMSYSKKQAYAMYRHAQWLLARRGLSPRQGQTLGEFATQVTQACPDESIDAARAYAVYSKAFYAQEALSETECRTLSGFIHTLEAQAKKSMNKAVYFFYHYVLRRL